VMRIHAAMVRPPAVDPLLRHVVEQEGAFLWTLHVRYGDALRRTRPTSAVVVIA